MASVFISCVRMLKILLFAVCNADDVVCFHLLCEDVEDVKDLLSVMLMMSVFICCVRMRSKHIKGSEVCCLLGQNTTCKFPG